MRPPADRETSLLAASTRLQTLQLNARFTIRRYDLVQQSQVEAFGSLSLHTRSSLFDKSHLSANANIINRAIYPIGQAMSSNLRLLNRFRLRLYLYSYLYIQLNYISAFAHKTRCKIALA